MRGYALWLVPLVLGACGTTDAPKYTTPPTGEVTPGTLVTAGIPASDAVVALTPTTYDASSPCASLQVTTRVVNFAGVPLNCFAAWSTYSEQLIPGQDLVANSPIPKTARISPDLFQSDATADANAYYRFVMVRNWAYNNNLPALVKEMDTSAYSPNDFVLNEMTKNFAAVTAPACNLPTTFRVTKVDSGVQDYIKSIGVWPNPSTFAIVSNYAACPGYTFSYQDGTTKTKFGQDRPAADIMTGHVLQTNTPFGGLWVIDGYAICGEPQVKSVCGTN